MGIGRGRAVWVAAVLFGAAATGFAASPAERGQALWDEGKPEEAEKVLVEALGATPADAAARLVLGRLQAWDGRPDVAVDTWSAGLTGKEPDVPLLQALADLHLQRAADGPQVTRKRGATVLQFDGTTAQDPAAFARKRRESALEARRKASALRPADRELVYALATLLVSMEKAAEALPMMESISKKEPKNVRYLCGWSAALLATGKGEDARKKAEQAAKLAPRSPDGHAALSRALDALGKGPEALASRKRAELFSWLPEFSRLEYSDALYDDAAALARGTGWDTPREEIDRVLAAKRAVIDRLVAKRDPAAFDLLACVCWNHCCHGELEGIAFAALEGRGAPSVPLLRRMLDDGEATCTVGAAARSLARLREASAFEAVLGKLAADTDPFFPMDIAAALTIYGDPRAVPALAAAMRVDAPPLPPPPKRKGREVTVVVGGDGGAREGTPDGPFAARLRATMAVGEFDVPEARAALEKGCANPDLAPFCHAVLWRLTGDEKAHGRHVAEAVRAKAGPAPEILGPYLARIDHPVAKALYEEWNRARVGGK